MQIPVAARSKAWFCGLSLAGIVSSNLAGGMDVSYESSVLSGRGFLRRAVPLVQSATECDRQASMRTEAVAPREK